MRLPNGYGSVIKLSGKRRNPYLVRKTAGWHYDKDKDKQVQDYLIIGYAPTKADGLQMLADYNNNPFDTATAKITFQEVFEKWSKSKFQTISASNVNGYWKPLLLDMGILNYTNDKDELKEHTPDDTRHTFTTMWKEKKLDEAMRRKIQGHSGKGIGEMVYTHFEFEQLCNELNKL